MNIVNIATLQKKKGFTLIELLVCIVIGAVAWYAYSMLTASDSEKSEAPAKEVQKSEKLDSGLAPW